VALGANHVERVGRGKVRIWRRVDGGWGVTWLPDQGERDYPGLTYTPDIAPPGMPNDYDPEALMFWARRYWGGKQR
jgi:hypothetical protein